MKRRPALIAALVAPWLFAASSTALAIVKWDAGNCATSGLLATCSPTTEGPPSVVYSAISNTGANASLASAYVGMYGSNMGVTSKAGPNASPSGQETTSSPQHAMDNNGNSEFMLLSFAGAVSLSAVELGWSQTDSDITVLAYKPTGAQTIDPNPTADVDQRIDDLQPARRAWMEARRQLRQRVHARLREPEIGDDQRRQQRRTPLSSSYWLIGAYNSTNFGTASDPNSYSGFVNGQRLREAAFGLRHTHQQNSGTGIVVARRRGNARADHAAPPARRVEVRVVRDCRTRARTPRRRRTRCRGPCRTRR